MAKESSNKSSTANSKKPTQGISYRVGRFIAQSGFMLSGILGNRKEKESVQNAGRRDWKKPKEELANSCKSIGNTAFIQSGVVAALITIIGGANLLRHSENPSAPGDGTKITAPENWSNTEQAAKAIAEEFYAKQREAFDKGKIFSQEEVLQENRKLTTKMYDSIKKIIGDELPEAEGNREKVIAVADYFKKEGYIYALGPMPASKNQGWMINGWLYKISPNEERNISAIQEEGLPKFDDTITIHQTDEIAYDRFDSSKYQKDGMHMNGFTHMDSRGNAPIITTFPNNIAKSAKKVGMSEGEYRENVVLNELAHVYFQKIVPRHLFNEDLGGVTVNQIQEAFSDYVTIKYGNNWTAEAQRVIETQNRHSQYDLSREIITKALTDIKSQQEEFLPPDLHNKQVSFDEILDGLQRHGTMESAKEKVLLPLFDKHCLLYFREMAKTLSDQE